MLSNYLNIKLACSCKNTIFTLLSFIFSITLLAQKKDTLSYQLQEVTISSDKQTLFEPFKKKQAIDSLVLKNYATSTLSDLLANQSTIHIKAYGNANIATTSIRGGNANQTALLWNGLNIQNAMLGQPDLSIIPSSLFNQVSLEYGGGSTMWGSGAIGGSILLSNTLKFNEGFKTNLRMSVGSFETKRINSSVLLSYKKIISNTNVFYNTSENNYKYIDTTSKENKNKQTKHASYSHKGLMQELSFLINSHQTIHVRLWYNYLNRNIPDYLGTNQTKNQVDENLKSNLEWNYHKRRLQSIIRLGFFNDWLNYKDSLAQNLSSKSTIKTLIAENDNIYKLNIHRFNIGINYTGYKTDLQFNNLDTNYSNNHTLHKLALFAAYQLNLFDSKLQYHLSVRKEFSNQLAIPFTGSSGLKYQLIKPLSLKINANKSFRQPTLNDLYWQPGGNPNLKSEDSYELEGGIEFNHSIKKLTLKFEATYFNRHVKNQIIWLPSSGGYWTPRNIAEVYGRGTETSTELAYHHKDIYIKLYLNTSYVLSTNQVKMNENDNSVGRQLIYTPRYSGLGGISFYYKNFGLLFNNHYTGYQFTSTDNTTWINPYLIGNLKLSYRYAFSTVETELFAHVNNLYNKNYVVVANMPMPLRNYEAGLRISYSKRKKTKQPTSINELIQSTNKLINKS